MGSDMIERFEHGWHFVLGDQASGDRVPGEADSSGDAGGSAWEESGLCFSDLSFG